MDVIKYEVFENGETFIVMLSVNNHEPVGYEVNNMEEVEPLIDALTEVFNMGYTEGVRSLCTESKTIN